MIHFATQATVAQVSAPQAALPLNDLHYALVVGINKYPGMRDLQGNPRDLRAADNDARAFCEWLLDGNGGALPPENIAHVRQGADSFPNAESAVPTRTLVNGKLKSLIDAIRAKLKQQPTNWNQSRLYVYVSGHGIAPNAREAALLMANATADSGGESLPARLYMDYLQDIQVFHELVFFADCCRTPRMSAQLHGPPWDQVAGQYGEVATVLGFATNFGELAYEPTEEEEADPNAARGFFTQALLEGLAGSAAESGWVDSNSLAKYVSGRVADLTAHKRRRQQAPFIASANQPIRFCRAQQPDCRVTIEFPADFKGTVEVFNHSARIASFVASDGVARLGLRSGLYEVRPADAADGAIFENGGLFKVRGAELRVRLELAEPT